MLSLGFKATIGQALEAQAIAVPGVCSVAAKLKLAVTERTPVTHNLHRQYLPLNLAHY